MKIESVKVNADKSSGNTDVKIKINDFSDNARVHVLASQYLANDPYILFSNLYK